MRAGQSSSSRSQSEQSALCSAIPLASSFLVIPIDSHFQESDRRYEETGEYDTQEHGLA